MELIVLHVGLNLKVISPGLFAMMVVMVVLAAYNSGDKPLVQRLNAAGRPSMSRGRKPRFAPRAPSPRTFTDSSTSWESRAEIERRENREPAQGVSSAARRGRPRGGPADAESRRSTLLQHSSGTTATR